MGDARVVLDKLGLIGRSKQRTRRPTLAELDKLMTYYTVAEVKRKDIIPMTRLIPFAIFSTRRQEEITRMEGKDLDKLNLEIIVRDMKNPGEKIGIDVTTMLTPESLQLIELQPATQAIIWPYNAESVSASFTRACAFLGIDDLHFHDLRHEGISRLFEMGWNIPRVACVSGHRSWTSLKRYTHLRQSGDKYKDWPWLAKVLGDTGASKKSIRRSEVCIARTHHPRVPAPAATEARPGRTRQRINPDARQLYVTEILRFVSGICG